MAMGTSADMRSMAEALDKIGASLLRGYAAKSGKAEKDIAKMMAKETWLDAAEALEMGFADTMAEPVKMAASFDVSRFQNTPPEIIEAVKAKDEPVTVEPEPEPDASPVGETTPDPDPATIRNEAMAYAKTVVDLCRLSGQPQMAAGFLSAETSLEDIHKALIDARAKDDPDISAAHPQPGKSINSRPWAEVIAQTFKRKG